MHRFDPELVAALAEGTLEAAEAAELEAQIAGDPGSGRTGQTAGGARRHPHRRFSAARCRGAQPLRAAVAEQLGLTPSESSVTRPRRVAWGQSPLPPRRCLQSLPSPP